MNFSIKCNAISLLDRLYTNQAILKQTGAESEYSLFEFKRGLGEDILVTSINDSSHVISNITDIISELTLSEDISLFYVDGSLLVNLLRNFGSHEVSLVLDTKSNKLVISDLVTGKSNYKIGVVFQEQFSHTIKWPEDMGQISLTVGELKSIIVNCLGYLLKDSYEESFGYIYVDKGRVYATDKHHGIIINMPSLKDCSGIYINPEILRIISKMDDKVIIYITKTGGLVQFIVKDQCLFGYNYPASKYPIDTLSSLHDMAINSKRNFEAVIDSHEFLKAVKNLSVVSNKVHYGIDIVFDGNSVELRTYDNENIGEGYEEVKVKSLNGNKFNVRINNKQLVNMLELDNVEHLWCAESDMSPQYFFHNKDVQCIKFCAPLAKLKG